MYAFLFCSVSLSCVSKGNVMRRSCGIILVQGNLLWSFENIVISPLDHCQSLNTLFNIVEAPFKKIVEPWCVCCMMMFNWTNKQPWIQTFWNLCGLYQDIYDWILPLNKWSGSSFILTQQSMGRNEYGISGHLHIFAFWKHTVLVRCSFFRASFLHLFKDTDSM